MKAEIISVGTELLMGELTDTNASWIAGRLPALGIQLQWVSIVGDDLPKLTEAFVQGWQRSDIIFTTGGLGPTQDDLTREAVAAALGETPVVQEQELENLRQWFRNRGQDMPTHNVKQAHLIPSAEFITNRNGTAPGWWAQRDGKHIICMPGPPGENRAMWQGEIDARLKEIIDTEVTITRNIKTLGLGEASVDEIMDEYFGLENPYLGIYSKADGIHLRIIARAADEAAAREMIAPIEDAIHDRLAPYVWGYDDETPELSVGAALVSRGMTLATMESVSGGFLANTITEAPDSNQWYRGGNVAYTMDAMVASGVDSGILETHGVVSQQTANAMAQVAQSATAADFGIGMTGVLGPQELEGHRPGTIHIAIAHGDDVREFPLRTPPRRLVIKRRSCNTALTELRKLITEVAP
ncbi:MAG: CinA family nicotinamide mononucleotide deamidase-related protein [Chloroflexota bacterium]|nr:CinA family nicotinamide mononucleotide deamidase-related protein [Chloroflexota bacterium]MDE2960545.1 CinA family nicotinamide mononucleotide deamidase-related protein [Chloroflexota bacterium]